MNAEGGKRDPELKPPHPSSFFVAALKAVVPIEKGKKKGNLGTRETRRSLSRGGKEGECRGDLRAPK